MWILKRMRTIINKNVRRVDVAGDPVFNPAAILICREILTTKYTKTTKNQLDTKIPSCSSW